MPYQDVLNNALDDLAFALQQTTTYPVVTDPRQINAPCIFIDAPTWTAINWNVVQIDYPVKVIGSGPGDLYAMRQIMATCSGLITAQTGIMSGRPATAVVGGTEMPCYDCTITVEASAN